MANVDRRVAIQGWPADDARIAESDRPPVIASFIRSKYCALKKIRFPSRNATAGKDPRLIA